MVTMRQYDFVDIRPPNGYQSEAEKHLRHSAKNTMGLDISMFRKQYALDEQVNVLRKIGKDRPDMFKPEGRVQIVEEVGYWRKANQIHAWFVDNVQEGRDDCREYEFDREKLHELRDVIEKVKLSIKLIKGRIPEGYTLDEAGKRVYSYRDGLVVEDATIAKELLPRKRGFFFGSEYYDEEYLMDLDHTLEVIDKALDSPARAWFSYQSSW